MKIKASLLSALLFFCLQSNVFAQNLSVKQDEKTNLYGFADTDDKYVITPKYKEVDFSFSSKPGLYKVVDKKDKVGYINEEAKEIVACKYDEGGPLEKGFAMVKIKTGDYEYKCGLIDSTGHEIIALRFGHMEFYPEEEVVIIGYDNTSNVGVMSFRGEMLIAPQYEFWSKRISKGLWPVGRHDTCGVVNLKNETVVPFIYEMIESYSDESDVAPAKKGGKYGFIDRTGKVAIPFVYEDAWTSGPYLAVRKDKKWGVVDKDNKEILPFDYASVSSINSQTAWVQKDEKEEAYEINLATKQRVKR